MGLDSSGECMKELVRVIGKRRDERVSVQLRRGMQRNGYKSRKALKRSDPDAPLGWLSLTPDFSPVISGPIERKPFNLNGFFLAVVKAPR